MKKTNQLFYATITTTLTLFALSTNVFATQLNTISGSVYQQKQSNDGITTKRGRQFKDVYLHLIDINGKLVAETRTDQHGNYRFTHVKPGNYQIEVPLNTGDPRDVNRLLLDSYASPSGSYRDVEVSGSDVRNLDLKYYYIDLRTRTSRHGNYQGIDN